MKEIIAYRVPAPFDKKTWIEVYSVSDQGFEWRIVLEEGDYRETVNGSVWEMYGCAEIALRDGLIRASE